MTPETTILYGDAWELALILEPQSIDCIVTSPPYWGLRDYGHPDQFGLERTPQEYVAKLVDLFARLRPALKDEGTLWLNLGDSYTSGGRTSYDDDDKWTGRGGRFRPGAGRADGVVDARGQRNRNGVPACPGLKPKDLAGIPWRVAFALQEDGWYLRSDIIWAKPNPMPKSVTDRPTKAHEYLFLLAKSERYYFDREAVAERIQSDRAPSRKAKVTGAGRNGLRAAGKEYDGTESARNIRSVWTIAPQPYPECHFATFPPKLIEPCVKAGTSAWGVCPECGRPWERVVRRTAMLVRPGPSRAEALRAGSGSGRRDVRGTMLEAPNSQTLGWQPSCSCGCAPVPATVLDPFLGSGTTAEVARKLGRNCIGFELNEGYRPLIEKRLAQGVLL